MTIFGTYLEEVFGGNCKNSAKVNCSGLPSRKKRPAFHSEMNMITDIARIDAIYHGNRHMNWGFMSS